MKILKYKKNKDGLYQIYLEDGNSFLLHENIILKYELLLKKEINNKDINNMLNENNKYIAYNLAIKYLGTKMRSRKEIRNFLTKKEIDNNTINEVIELLIKEKYIDDLSYAKAYVNDKILLTNDGPNKISSKLKELGISEDKINQALESFDKDTEREKVTKIVNKLISTNKNKSVYILKNKISYYLVNLGYNRDVINLVIDSTTFKENKDIAKKEYEKIYKKLSKKYSGSELEYKVKEKMYALGFNNYSE